MKIQRFQTPISNAGVNDMIHPFSRIISYTTYSILLVNGVGGGIIIMEQLEEGVKREEGEGI
jgi:hypothetical protein